MLREKAMEKQTDKESARLKKVENQIKAKEYAKRQREIITKGKIPTDKIFKDKSSHELDTQPRSIYTTSRDNQENDSPNVGANTHTHIVNIQSDPHTQLNLPEPKNTDIIHELSEENASQS